MFSAKLVLRKVTDKDVMNYLTMQELQSLDKEGFELVKQRIQRVLNNYVGVPFNAATSQAIKNSIKSSVAKIIEEHTIKESQVEVKNNVQYLNVAFDSRSMRAKALRDCKKLIKRRSKNGVK